MYQPLVPRLTNNVDTISTIVKSLRNTWTDESDRYPLLWLVPQYSSANSIPRIIDDESYGSLLRKCICFPTRLSRRYMFCRSFISELPRFTFKSSSISRSSSRNSLSCNVALCQPAGPFPRNQSHSISVPEWLWSAEPMPLHLAAHNGGIQSHSVLDRVIIPNKSYLKDPSLSSNPIMEPSVLYQSVTLGLLSTPPLHCVLRLWSVVL
jgi:hypothetical protein